MAKMKVHELAKELEIESKNIIEFLKGTEHEVKAAQSSLENAAQDMVRNKFAKKTVSAPKQEEAKTEAPKTEATKTDAAKNADDKQERPKKKSSISAVFNAQYSKQSRRPAGNNNNNSNY